MFQSLINILSVTCFSFDFSISIHLSHLHVSFYQYYIRLTIFILPYAKKIFLANFAYNSVNLVKKFHFCNDFPFFAPNFMIQWLHDRIKIHTKTGRCFCLTNFVNRNPRLIWPLLAADGLCLFSCYFLRSPVVRLMSSAPIFWHPSFCASSSP